MRSIPMDWRTRRRVTPTRTFQYAEGRGGVPMNQSRAAARIVAIFVLAGGCFNALADPAYSIARPDTVLTGMVTGTSVAIQVAAPSSALISRTTLKLNGADVTGALHADGAGAMSGVVAGLQPGANVFELWSKNSKEPVAQLTVMKGLAPAATCASLATLTGFPVQPSGSMGGTVITAARIVSAAGTTPEYCLVQGTMEERFDGVAGVAGTPSYHTNQRYRTLFEVRLPTA